MSETTNIQRLEFLRGISTRVILGPRTETEEIALSVLRGMPAYALLDRVMAERKAAYESGDQLKPLGALLEILRLYDASFISAGTVAAYAHVTDIKPPSLSPPPGT